MAKQIREYPFNLDKKAHPRKNAPVPVDREVTAPDRSNVRWIFKKPGKANQVRKPKSKARGGVVLKRLRDSSGKVRVYQFVDAKSDSFGSDFDRVFRSNVRKARRANRLIAGAPDRGVVES